MQISKDVIQPWSSLLKICKQAMPSRDEKCRHANVFVGVLVQTYIVFLIILCTVMLTTITISPDILYAMRGEFSYLGWACGVPCACRFLQ